MIHKINIVDYGIGNLFSVKRALEVCCKKNLVVSGETQDILSSDLLILPGVGAFGDAMEHLKQKGMDEAVKSYAQSGKWMHGICLGMQLLFEKSEEFGTHKGLELIPGKVQAFDTKAFNEPLKVPHMGWNKLFAKHHSPLFKGLDESFYLYFVHSLHVKTEDKYTIGSTHYGYDFASAVQKENIFGFQPHPEKSHDNGIKILENFMKL